MKLAEILHGARKARGWNLPQAAEKLGVVKSQILCWERGSYLPTKKNLRKLARGYRLQYERLAGLAAAELAERYA